MTPRQIAERILKSKNRTNILDSIFPKSHIDLEEARGQKVPAINRKTGKNVSVLPETLQNRPDLYVARDQSNASQGQAGGQQPQQQQTQQPVQQQEQPQQHQAQPEKPKSKKPEKKASDQDQDSQDQNNPSEKPKPLNRQPDQEEFSDVVKEVCQELLKENPQYVRQRMIPIHAIRDKMSEIYGQEQMRWQFNDRIMNMREKKEIGTLISISDRSQATPEELKKSIVDIGETFFFVDLSNDLHSATSDEKTKEWLKPKEKRLDKLREELNDPSRKPEPELELKPLPEPSKEEFNDTILGAVGDLLRYEYQNVRQVPIGEVRKRIKSLYGDQFAGEAFDDAVMGMMRDKHFSLGEASQGNPDNLDGGIHQFAYIQFNNRHDSSQSDYVRSKIGRYRGRLRDQKDNAYREHVKKTEAQGIRRGKGGTPKEKAASKPKSPRGETKTPAPATPATQPQPAQQQQQNKPLWQMSSEEVQSAIRKRTEELQKDAKTKNDKAAANIQAKKEILGGDGLIQNHASSIIQALKDGHNVPEEVLSMFQGDVKKAIAKGEKFPPNVHERFGQGASTSQPQAESPKPTSPPPPASPSPENQPEQPKPKGPRIHPDLQKALDEMKLPDEHKNEIVDILKKSKPLFKKIQNSGIASLTPDEKKQWDGYQKRVMELKNTAATASQDASGEKPQSETPTPEPTQTQPEQQVSQPKPQLQPQTQTQTQTDSQPQSQSRPPVSPPQPDASTQKQETPPPTQQTPTQEPEVTKGEQTGKENPVQPPQNETGKPSASKADDLLSPKDGDSPDVKKNKSQSKAFIDSLRNDTDQDFIDAFDINPDGTIKPNKEKLDAFAKSNPQEAGIYMQVMRNALQQMRKDSPPSGKPGQANAGSGPQSKDGGTSGKPGSPNAESKPKAESPSRSAELGSQIDASGLSDKHKESLRNIANKLHEAGAHEILNYLTVSPKGGFNLGPKANEFERKMKNDKTGELRKQYDMMVSLHNEHDKKAKMFDLSDSISSSQINETEKSSLLNIIDQLDKAGAHDFISYLTVNDQGRLDIDKKALPELHAKVWQDKKLQKHLKLFSDLVKKHVENFPESKNPDPTEPKIGDTPPVLEKKKAAREILSALKNIGYGEMAEAITVNKDGSITPNQEKLDKLFEGRPEDKQQAIATLATIVGRYSHQRKKDGDMEQQDVPQQSAIEDKLGREKPKEPTIQPPTPKPQPQPQTASPEPATTATETPPPKRDARSNAKEKARARAATLPKPKPAETHSEAVKKISKAFDLVSEGSSKKGIFGYIKTILSNFM